MIVGGSLGEVDRYVRAIRNPAKRAYANAYAAFVLGNATSEPECPADLSYMGAQAVRLSLQKLGLFPPVDGDAGPAEQLDIAGGSVPVGDVGANDAAAVTVPEAGGAQLGLAGIADQASRVYHSPKWHGSVEQGALDLDGSSDDG